MFVTVGLGASAYLSLQVSKIGTAATVDVDVSVVGGTSAVLVGWRGTTVDFDLVIRPEQRSPVIRWIGQVTFQHYDFVAQALAKIERGHARDVADVDAMLTHGFINAALVREQFARMEPQLYRFSSDRSHVISSRRRFDVSTAMTVVRLTATP